MVNSNKVPEKETARRTPEGVSVPEFLKEHKGTQGSAGEKSPEGMCADRPELKVFSEHGVTPRKWV